MRKSGVYVSGLYMEYAGKYYERREWKEKWRRRVGVTAAVLLAAAVGIHAAEGAADYADAVQTVNAGLEESTVRVSAGAVSPKMISAAQERLSDIIEEKEREAVVYTGGAPGAVAKAVQDTLVMLDPGHGGTDEGCSRNNIMEKDINLQITLAVQAQLRELGYQVQLTRTSDTALTLEERVDKAVQAEADVYVSIHQNASEYTQANGIEVLYSNERSGAESERLSELIHKYTVEETEASGREILSEEELYVIRECTMPSCLVETGFLSNATERQKLMDPEYQEKIAEGIANGIHRFLHPKTMYLTFDDGPSAENTARVLDILKEYDIHATFFLVGENVKKHPEIAKRIAEEGHTIGIHCNSHEYKTLYASVDSYVSDFEEAHRIVQEVTGVDARLFRFPGGSINAYNKKVYKKIAEEMTERGYIYYDWNASLEDAVEDAKPQTLIDNALSSTLGREHVVMLAHDVVYPTAQCLPEIIENLPEYRMEPLTEGLTPIQF